MYLRHTTVRKNGKTHTYWRLVRSVRTGTKVRQHTVAQLGELDAQGRLRAQALAESIAGIERQPGLFEEGTPAEPVRVVLQELRLERGRRFGDIWLAWRLWQALGLDRLLQGLLPRRREEVPWATMAAGRSRRAQPAAWQRAPPACVPRPGPARPPRLGPPAPPGAAWGPPRREGPRPPASTEPWIRSCRTKRSWKRT